MGCGIFYRILQLFYKKPYLCGMENIKEIFDPWWEQLVYCARNCKSSGRLICIEFGDITLKFHYNYDIYELVQRNELWLASGKVNLVY